MYHLDESDAFTQELQDLEEEAPGLRQVLARSGFLVLTRDPTKGSHTRACPWVLRVKGLAGLYFIDLYYRVREEDRRVTLISVNLVDASRM